jgi:hypothetical protein
LSLLFPNMYSLHHWQKYEIMQIIRQKRFWKVIDVLLATVKFVKMISKVNLGKLAASFYWTYKSDSVTYDEQQISTKYCWTRFLIFASQGWWIHNERRTPWISYVTLG